jgi:hypothetical protein
MLDTLDVNGLPSARVIAPGSKELKKSQHHSSSKPPRSADLKPSLARPNFGRQRKPRGTARVTVSSVSSSWSAAERGEFRGAIGDKAMPSRSFTQGIGEAEPAQE